MPKGDCFEAAISFARQLYSPVDFDLAQVCLTPDLSMWLSGDPVMIVHGLPKGLAGDVLGKRFWHGWVEKDGLVFDAANDRLCVAVKTVYYDMGELDETLVWRWTYPVAMKEMVVRKHWGPWIDGWEKMDEVG